MRSAEDSDGHEDGPQRGLAALYLALVTAVARMIPGDVSGHVVNGDISRTLAKDSRMRTPS
jgi:hypothetical protein